MVGEGRVVANGEASGIGSQLQKGLFCHFDKATYIDNRLKDGLADLLGFGVRHSVLRGNLLAEIGSH